jgi:hypothetical protein
MECPHCRAQLSSQARFCGSCGRGVGASPARDEIPPGQGAPAWLWGFLGTLVVGLALALALALLPVRRLWFSMSGEPDPQGGPRAEELRQRVAPELPGFLKLRSLDLQASENVGDRAEPVFKSRFQGEVDVTTPTFRVLAREADVVFVTPVAKPGESRRIFGLALSRLQGGAWSTVFQFDNDPATAFGVPQELLGGARVIEKGSAEEANYRAEERRQLDLAQAAAREQQALAEQAAREERLRAEQAAQEEAARQAEIARRQGEAEAAAREQHFAAQRAPILKSIQRRSYLLGEMTPPGWASRYSFRIRFTSYEPSTGSVEAIADLGQCEVRLEGMVANEDLMMRGVQFLRPGPDCSLGYTWRLSLAQRPWRGAATPPGQQPVIGFGVGPHRFVIQVE